jgi:hypothetical protein
MWAVIAAYIITTYIIGGCLIICDQLIRDKDNQWGWKFITKDLLIFMVLCPSFPIIVLGYMFEKRLIMKKDR